MTDGCFMKFVDFEYYCPKCKYWKLDGDQDPCSDCLTTPARKNTKKPELYDPSEERL